MRPVLPRVKSCVLLKFVPLRARQRGVSLFSPTEHMVTAIHQVSIFRRHSGGMVWSLNMSGSVPAIDVVRRRAGFQPQLRLDSPRGKEGELPLVLASTSRALLVPVF